MVCCLTGRIIIRPGIHVWAVAGQYWSIEGVVTDPSGSAVPNAEVALTNLGTNFTRVLQTDQEGRFRGLLLPLGPYKVTVKAPNFGTLARTGLDLAVGQSISLT